MQNLIAATAVLTL